MTFRMPLGAVLCRYLPRRERNFAFSLGGNSFFEPEGRGFESLPAYHINQALTCALISRRQVGFPSSVTRELNAMA